MLESLEGNSRREVEKSPESDTPAKKEDKKDEGNKDTSALPAQDNASQNLAQRINELRGRDGAGNSGDKITNYQEIESGSRPVSMAEKLMALRSTSASSPKPAGIAAPRHSPMALDKLRGAAI